MENPFDIIDRRLSTVEELLLDIKHRPNAIPQPVEEVLTIQQAAALLDLTTQTVYGFVSARKLPFYKPTGAKLYFLRSELIDWLKSHRNSTIEERTQEFTKRKVARLTKGGAA